MSDLKKYVIATRESQLAMWQALHIQARLRSQYPSLTVDLLGMTTRGDQILDKTLSKVGGKGLFVKELETALQNEEADLAVHSLKDVPMTLPDGFELVAITEREDPRDAFVSPQYDTLQALPAGAKVGTSSLRRQLFLKVHFPHLEVLTIRGNVQTRLAKLHRGEFDALVMATAGLKRLGLDHEIKQILDPEVSLPSPGQGALGIEIRQGRSDLKQALSFLNDANTRACCMAERAVSRAFGGSCQVPLAAYAVVDKGELFLRAAVGNHLTGEVAHAHKRGRIDKPEQLALEVVELLRQAGADAYLKAILG